MGAPVSYFGIRHHGPGSAASLVGALDALDPEVVLIEGPPEADGIIPFAAAVGTRPPVAILSFAPDEPSRSVFHPFALFSPEWQAIQWALARGREVRFIDWPAAHSIAWCEPDIDLGTGIPCVPSDGVEGPLDDGDADPADGTTEGEDAVGDAAPRHRDPLTELAIAAGHSDGEAWWDATVERGGGHAGTFAAVEEAMTALREARGPAALDPREAVREAFMRLAVREAEAKATGPVAVVVGAWHVPALRAKTKVSDDRALVRGLPKVKVESTWIPWTEERLAERSGYAAGIVSPGWYGHLWESRGEDGQTDPRAAACGWQAKATAHLRSKGHSASTALAIDASNLTLSLAALRGFPVPGLPEVRDAALATTCGGDEGLWAVIERDLVVGRAVGSIDPGVPQMPLMADLAVWQKRTRLKPESLPRDVSVDLRTEAGLLKSTLLHRLAAIGVDWGRLVDAEAGRGTFREKWTISWQPELAVKLAEALVHGPTIEIAARESMLAEARAEPELAKLSALVKAALTSDLPDAAREIIDLLGKASTGVDEVHTIVPSVVPLVEILRYGTARLIPEAELRRLAGDLAARVVAGFPRAVRNIDAETGRSLFLGATAFHASLPLLGDEHLSSEWLETLLATVDVPDASPLLRGFAARRVHDGGQPEDGWTAGAISRALSLTARAVEAASFLEGFLGRDGEVLLHDASILGAVDGWLASRDEEAFTEILPMLRRSFATFDSMQRKRLYGAVAKPGGTEAAVAVADVDEAGYAAAVEAIGLYFGLAA